jgi:hypothetical protein
MIKRQWKGDPTCYFCHLPESTTHLLFTCSVAKTLWATIATCIGATNIPTSFNQSWKWCERWIPSGKQFYVFGIAAVCWSIWKMRNRICFDGKKTQQSPGNCESRLCFDQKAWTPCSRLLYNFCPRNDELILSPTCCQMQPGRMMQDKI